MSTLNDSGIAALLATLGSDDTSTFTTNQQTHVLHRPIDIYRIQLASVLSQLTGCDNDICYDAIQLPSSLPYGDLTVPVPRLRVKGKKPADLCTELAANFPETHLFQKPTAQGIHLTFQFSSTILPRLLLPYIFDRGQTYGSVPGMGLRGSGPGRKKVIVEFSSVNIAKEFHVGHMRSTIIGAFISNLYQSMGWDVLKLNYLGDWGKQFGLLAVGWRRFGSEEELAKDPLKHLLDVYSKINTLFKPEAEASAAARKQGLDTSEIESKGLYKERNDFFKLMENGDVDALALWERFREISIERFIPMYARLNVEFDEYSGESQVKSATMDEVESILKEKNVYEEENGSWVIDFEKLGFKGLGKAIVRGRNGSTTYLLRDIAAALEREEKHNFEKMIYVVSTEQDIYFRRLIKTVELLGRPDLAARLQHINFGKVKGMSSRMGNVKFLSDILDQAGDAMHGVMRRNETKYAQIEEPGAVADAVGNSAVMIQDMSGKRIHDYDFDIDRMTSFEGDTGPYLQYCHARLNSILRRAGLERAELQAFINGNDSLLADDVVNIPHCKDLLRIMAQYPEVTTAALNNLEPSTILTYLFRLAHQLSSCYDVIRVVDPTLDRDTMLGRAALYEAARQVLENGMRLLGLTPVER